MVEDHKGTGPKDQAVVHIPDVPYEEVVVRENLFEVDGPNLFTDGHHHQT